MNGSAFAAISIITYDTSYTHVSSFQHAVTENSVVFRRSYVILTLWNAASQENNFIKQHTDLFRIHS